MGRKHLRAEDRSGLTRVLADILRPVLVAMNRGELLDARFERRFFHRFEYRTRFGDIRSVTRIGSWSTATVYFTKNLHIELTVREGAQGDENA